MSYSKQSLSVITAHPPYPVNMTTRAGVGPISIRRLRRRLDIGPTPTRVVDLIGNNTYVWIVLNDYNYTWVMWYVTLSGWYDLIVHIFLYNSMFLLFSCVWYNLRYSSFGFQSPVSVPDIGCKEPVINSVKYCGGMHFLTVSYIILCFIIIIIIGCSNCRLFLSTPAWFE